MTTIQRPSFTQPRRTTPLQPVTTPSPRREYRERDFGVGYGSSSGYATRRQYVSGWNGEPRFRFG